jgi:hypothetical protein
MGKPPKKAKPDKAGQPAKPAKEIPSPDTVLAEFEVHPPGGEPHRVLRTSQVDEYEEPAALPKKKNKPAGSPKARRRKKK